MVNPADGKINDTTVSVDNRFRKGVEGEEDITTGYAVTTDTPGMLSVKFDNVPRTFSCEENSTILEEHSYLTEECVILNKTPYVS